MHNLSEKVALIIGLGQSSLEGWGIGSAIAVLLAQQGAKIVGGNRSLQSAEITKRRIEEFGGSCEIFQTDATSSASVKSLVDICREMHGRIDILINNVGQSAPGDPASMEEGVWDSQMDLNLKSVYLACHFVLPIMEGQRDGRIVSVSSIAGLRYIGKPQVGYNAAKAAIIHLMKSTAVIYADKNVRLNTVVPGLMYTPYTEELAKRYGAVNDEEKSTYMRTREAQVPMMRMGDAWDVAHAVLFLVSDEARYITAQEIVVDGGITSSTGQA
jgi:NAD(P)-dependent dehydrogenase (short-subunit alcohol dehydrogenase family)